MGTKIGNLNLASGFVGDKALQSIWVGNNKVYDSGSSLGHKCTINGLGNQDPSTITFIRDNGFPTTFEEVNVNGNIFIKFPKFYRKVREAVDGQITSFTIADAKIDNTYELYPCFKKYNGIVETGEEAEYVLIGKYCCSSSSVANSINAEKVNQTLANGRSNAIALGNGYQLYDWKLQKLFVDLALAVSKKFNFNDGSTSISEYLGIAHLNGNVWVDGVVNYSERWLISYDPSKYVSSVTTTTDGYTDSGYTHPTSNNYGIKKLGYTLSNPFFNYPTEHDAENEGYTKYYCDMYFARSGSRTVYSNVGDATSDYGLFCTLPSADFMRTYGVRLCFIP